MIRQILTYTLITACSVYGMAYDIDRVANLNYEQFPEWVTKHVVPVLTAYNRTGISTDNLTRISKVRFKNQHLNNALARHIIIHVSRYELLLNLSKKSALRYEIARGYYITHRKELKEGELVLDVKIELSIADIINCSALPEVQNGVLALNDFKLYSLDGIDRIPDKEKVTTLDLSDNRLSVFPPKVFAQFPNLTILLLDTNMIERFENAPFQGCRNLEQISITNNRIIRIDKKFEDIPYGCVLKYTRYNVPAYYDHILGDWCDAGGIYYKETSMFVDQFTGLHEDVLGNNDDAEPVVLTQSAENSDD